MIDLRFSRYALGICAAVGILAGCGGSQAPVGAPGQSESGLPEAYIPPYHLYGTDWLGSGHDSTLGDADYELEFCKPPKAEGILAAVNKEKQSFEEDTKCPEYIQGVADMYLVDIIKHCKGFIKVHVLNSETLYARYKSRCGQVFHNGEATLDLCKDCKGSIRRH
jgi:hypothetical protein